MKISKFITAALILLALVSCKKSGNEVDPMGDEKEGTLSMEIDGTQWNGNCGALPTTPLGPGKIVGEFSGTLKDIAGGKSLVITKGKFQTTNIL